MNISIVVPVYRGEALIESLVERLAKSLPKFSKKYEVLLVNDGSPDNSGKRLQKLARNTVSEERLMRRHAQCHVMRLAPRNMRSWSPWIKTSSIRQKRSPFCSNNSKTDST
ncbi:MAG: glycosyltransferase [Anaerolineales bacterium]